ncbi:50S ribosomal protein L11 methyltransferase [Coprothermobacter proteolyticus DSM 5265]|uniref:50S ribosomal protein L11 methyltransferase n=1 Tax=Coprothermobacter proteolyticus TaxID=35786 RepID=UPI00117F53D0|nr:50S ribosomal protein L11 methyltransferase [Coprothermobacter proteolyticus]ACI17249.2 50S ribosomal protein L11 methyltransferase [Coprothermobacter proteolyticus DSM 5265]
MPEKKFKRYAIKVEDEQDFEKLLADLHERFPNMGYLVQNANGTSIVELYLPEDAKLPEDISQRWPIEELGYDNQQWLDDLRGKFKGVSVAGTRILPPWEEHREDDLLIYPGMAFGTGEHASTQLALVLLSILPLQGKSLLDVGTGSGILAIYAKKRGCSKVTGVDIDPISVENALDNAKLNDVDISFEVADAYELKGEYDVVSANLVTDLLLGLREVLQPLAREFLVLSGIPFEDYNRIVESFGEPYLAVFGEDWIAFLYRRT